MIEHFFPNSVVVDCLHSGPLGHYIDAFAQQLAAQGYAKSSAQHKLRLVNHFSRWLDDQDLAVAEIDEQTIHHFLDYPNQHVHLRGGDCATLRILLTQLRDQGVVTTFPPEIDNLHFQIESDFNHYLTRQRNLAASTIDSYLEVVHRFLGQRFDQQRPELESLCTEDVTRFMLAQSQRYSSARAKLIATALRSFFRFLFQRGVIAIDLSKSVPTVAHWHLSTLPRFMSADEVSCLLQACDQRTAQGRRDYAILLLLARLGLRAGEVAALTLDDLDWERAELLVKGKSSRRERLPILHDVGEALTNYLYDGRPVCATRQVFVCLRAPQRGFANGQAVSTIVRRTLVRAGLKPPLKGAHLLRHSLATELLRNGASLVEIGELLRHRNLKTTQIYAKVDQATLSVLAQPWPGGQS